MRVKIHPRILFLCIATIIFLISLQLSSTVESHENVTETAIGKQYPVTIDDWSQFSSLEEKIEAIQVPESELKAMTTDDLLDALTVYPLWRWAIMPSLQGAYDQMYIECNVLQEFVSRSDAEEKLTEMLDRIESLYNSEKISKSEYVWGRMYFETILANLP